MKRGRCNILSKRNSIIDPRACGAERRRLMSGANERRITMGPNIQTQGANNKIITSTSLKPKISDSARILILYEDDVIAERLNIVLRGAGYTSERAKSITAGCESARSGRFQVVISASELADGSWRRLVDIASYYNLSFVVLLAASPFDFNQSAEAIENGAFDVLDVAHELPRVAEVTKRALWAAYLKGACPCPELASPRKAA
jgi:PleD family two-component response regulator